MKKFIIFPKAFYLTAEHGRTACEKDEFTLQFSRGTIQAQRRPTCWPENHPIFLHDPSAAILGSRTYNIEVAISSNEC
jgi:hypothetical protein